MIKQFVRIVNNSDEPQKYKHPKLAQVSILPAIPGGFIPVSAMQFEVQPGQAVTVPMVVYNTTPSMWRQPWVSEISEEEWLERAAIDTDSSREVDTRPWWMFRGKRVRIDKAAKKQIRFTDEAGKSSWTSRAKWEAFAEQEETPAAEVIANLQGMLAEAAEKQEEVLGEIYAALCDGIPQLPPIEGATTFQNIMAAILNVRQFVLNHRGTERTEAETEGRDARADTEGTDARIGAEEAGEQSGGPEEMFEDPEA